MSKPYTEQDLSDIFDSDLVWRRKELSDMKSAIYDADSISRHALLRALVAMSYAHWEGYVRTCATRYFEHLTLRKKFFSDYERQIYVNSMLCRLDSLYQSRTSIKDRCTLINDILDGIGRRFTYINQDLVDTRSNLNTDVVKDICLICGVDSSHFEDKRTFIDLLLLKRRNAIAHGQQEYIRVEEIDDFIANVLSIMSAFRNLLENKVYTKAYAA
ncbi:MAG: MAE_28990/MAE_18760 family HEPN-like nuclease [Candidatus Thiodiazotropha taylori]|uniref:MAE_28990/MAE_18760 family HEPN-like nuclease n=1 Tax=Candidatus Thiodiazotropha taylori TaxID=2792791 RepID=A0A9E4KE07_9GAMM|nr:MAE_28990/MAE_18760 family HEPN-like nuclease [Candidatus Thiodiazotropha taylori]MCW4256817.1 MAE_28990/MAE_18760 family HEPN-like nuclease [Candidatus Thiodiazotropha taylori]